MTLPVEISEVAGAEFNMAVDWYEQRQRGLGVRFTEAIQVVLNRISTHPRLHGVAFEDVRKAVVGRPFPYCVYFTVEPDHILIVSIFHTSRDLDELKRRNSP